MTSLKSSDPAFCLYVDHQGHPAPLSECFHATASRRLSSTLDRVHRPSTVTQVDSAYCPQCLSFHDASSATQLGYCPKSCLRCPLCTCIVQSRKVDAVFVLDCGRCDWNSLQCNLKVESSSAGDSTIEEEANALTQLTSQLQEKRLQGEGAEEHYQTMVAAWEGVVKATPKARLKGGRRKKEIEEEAWSVEALESSLESKQKKTLQKEKEVIGGQALQRINLEQEQTLDPNLQGIPVEALALQAGSKMADLLPLPVPLRSRKSRRCRAELAEGKPGILLKPKLNPLEGDSSLRTGHGQWWKKDSSAVHVVPRVRVIRHGSKPLDDNTQQHAFVLKVTNSTLGLVRLQIGMSAYHGEPFWEDDPEKNTALENLLVETLSNKHVDAFLLTTTSTTSSAFKSEMVELQSAELGMDFGKLTSEPDAVANWDADQVLAESPAPSEAPAENKVAFVTVKLLAEQSGSAWFEMICVTQRKSEGNVFTAIPISLQIQVGDGSWDGSLIVKATTEEEDKKTEMVAFDLVLTWPDNNKIE